MARNYRAEYDNYQGTAEQKKNRAARNRARREAERAGQVKKGDGKDVDHKRALSKGGSATAKSNRRITTASDNRSFPRTSSGAMKRNT